MSEKSLSRRAFLKMVSALGGSGALAWVSSGLVEAAEDTPVVGGDVAEVGADETVAVTLVIDDDDVIEHPFAPYFAPYFVEGPSVFVHWDDMEDGDTWGVPNERED